MPDILYSKPNTMISFSGGIDSTYHAWKWLRENPKQKLLIHHVILKTRENRWEKEKEAVDKILQWFRDNNINNFEYFESTLDLLEIDPQILDSTIIAFTEALFISRRKYITKILNNTPKNELLRLGTREYARRFNRAIGTREAVLGYKVDVFANLRPLMKEDIMRKIPQDLLDLCWYCRRPTEDGGVCGKCHTCKQVAYAKDTVKTKEGKI